MQEDSLHGFISSAFDYGYDVTNYFKFHSWRTECPAVMDYSPELQM